MSTHRHNLEKIAVTLAQLRKATRALTGTGKVVRRNIVQRTETLPDPKRGAFSRAAHKMRKAYRRWKWRKGLSNPSSRRFFERMVEGKRRFPRLRALKRGGSLPVAIPRVQQSTVEQSLSKALDKNRRLGAPQLSKSEVARESGHVSRMSGKIYAQGDTAKKMQTMGKLPGGHKGKPFGHRDREAFNRTALLHEGAEIGKNPGKFGFSGHQSLKPPLQDLNIAATLKGPGKGAKHMIRAMRKPEMAGLKRAIPSLDRLNLGKQRLSRHAIKRVQEIYDAKAQSSLGQSMGHVKNRGELFGKA